jgi:hypothetical protein
MTRVPMRTMRFAVLVAMTVTVVVLPKPGEALPHGCVSATSSYWISGDVARRSVMLAVHTDQPCSFYYSPGDTYSGIGAFVVRCSTGGRAANPDISSPLDFVEGEGNLVVDEPIPQPCKPGAKVTIHANKPFRGGSVVAGSPT